MSRKPRRKYSWGFRSIRGVVISVTARNEHEYAPIEIKGPPGLVNKVEGLLEGRYSMNGHIIRGAANALELEALLKSYPPYGLSEYRPYPTHPHQIRPYPPLPSGAIP